jgi:hypothetical protein
MELRITVEELKKLGLSLTQYVLLWGLYNRVKINYFVVDENGIADLLKRQLVGYSTTTGEMLLTTLSLAIFEPPCALFDSFIETFPTRVKNNAGVVRVLSPDSPDTLSGRKLKHKWHVITKNNSKLQEHIIQCLKEEVRVRTNTGELYWMRNAETWLNKCTWEDYEYLLEQPKTEENKGIKMNEIRL